MYIRITRIIPLGYKSHITLLVSLALPLLQLTKLPDRIVALSSIQFIVVILEHTLACNDNSQPSANFRPFLGNGRPIVQVIAIVSTHFYPVSHSVFELTCSSSLQKYGWLAFKHARNRLPSYTTETSILNHDNYY